MILPNTIQKIIDGMVEVREGKVMRWWKII